MKYPHFITLIFSPSGDIWHLNKILSLKVSVLNYAGAGNIPAVTHLAIHSCKKSVHATQKEQLGPGAQANYSTSSDSPGNSSLEHCDV